MTTNQTIDGVSRELIEKAMLACFEAGHGITHDELRALLDAPACKTCHDQGEVPTGEVAYQGHFQPPEPVMESCPECGGEPAVQPQGDTVPVSARWTDWSMVTLEVDGHHRTYVECGKPEQPQGEPVAWVECSPAWLEAGGDCATAPRLCVGLEGISHLHPAHADQSAPVAAGVLMGGRRPIPAGIESLAQQVYQSWESQPGFVPWVDGGNSTKQDEARQIASRTFELALANQVGGDE